MLRPRPSPERLRTIARRSRVSLSTLYRYYGGARVRPAIEQAIKAAERGRKA